MMAPRADSSSSVWMIRPPDAGEPLREEVEDLGGRRDRVAGEEAAAGVERRDGAGLVPRHDELGGGDGVLEPAGRDVDAEGLRELAPRGEALQVRLEDPGLLLPELELDGLLHRLRRDAEELGQDAEGDDVLGGLRPGRLRGELDERHGDPRRLLGGRDLHVRDGRRVGGLVEDDRVGLRHDLALEAGEVGPVEDDEDVDGVALCGDRLGRHPEGAGRLASADLRPVGLHLDDVQAVAGAGLGHHFAHRHDAVAARADHREREVSRRHLGTLHGPPRGPRNSRRSLFRSRSEIHDADASGTPGRGALLYSRQFHELSPGARRSGPPSIVDPGSRALRRVRRFPRPEARELPRGADGRGARPRPLRGGGLGRGALRRGGPAASRHHPPGGAAPDARSARGALPESGRSREEGRRPRLGPARLPLHVSRAERLLRPRRAAPRRRTGPLGRARDGYRALRGLGSVHPALVEGVGPAVHGGRARLPGAAGAGSLSGSTKESSTSSSAGPTGRSPASTSPT